MERPGGYLRDIERIADLKLYGFLDIIVMSSSWGLTEIVLEGGMANNIYAFLCRAREECASEERDHCSEVIHTVKGDFCFALGLEKIFEDTGDSYWGPAV